MNSFVEIAYKKYLNEYPNADEIQVFRYLESLGYTNEEIHKIDLYQNKGM